MINNERIYEVCPAQRTRGQVRSNERCWSWVVTLCADVDSNLLERWAWVTAGPRFQTPQAVAGVFGVAFGVATRRRHWFHETATQRQLAPDAEV